MTAEEEIDQVIAKLVTLAGKGESPLDDVVHDIKSEEASSINNGGPDGQVRYLVEQLGEEEALKQVRALMEDRDESG
jgi:hypothetical protein